MSTRIDETKCIESPTGKHERFNDWWCEHCGAELGPEHDPVMTPEPPKPVCRTFCDQCCTPLACIDTDFVHCILAAKDQT